MTVIDRETILNEGSDSSRFRFSQRLAEEEMRIGREYTQEELLVARIFFLEGRRSHIDDELVESYLL